MFNNWVMDSQKSSLAFNDKWSEPVSGTMDSISLFQEEKLIMGEGKLYV